MNRSTLLTILSSILLIMGMLLLFFAFSTDNLGSIRLNMFMGMSSLGISLWYFSKASRNRA